MNESLLRLLVELAPVGAPVLSIYLDMRPHALGGRPALRDNVLMLGDQLRQLEKTLGPRGPELDSFRADVERINTYLAITTRFRRTAWRSSPAPAWACSRSSKACRLSIKSLSALCPICSSWPGS